MGLPQVSSSTIADEVTASLSTFAQHPPRFASVSSCDLDGMHGGSTVNRVSVDFPCTSSLGDFQKKTTLELSKGSDGSFMHKSTINSASGSHGLKIGAKEGNGWFAPKFGQSIHTPVSRIVGFESGGLDSFSGFEETSLSWFPSSAANGIASGNEIEPHGSIVHKRLLSPLNGMLYPSQFDGSPLDIGGGNDHVDSPVLRDRHSVSEAQDHKKANVSQIDYQNTPVSSVSSCLRWKNGLDNDIGRSFIFLDDGRIPINIESIRHNLLLPSPGVDSYGEASKVRTRTGSIPIVPKNMISPPLSLSPLGPKFSERMKIAGVHGVVGKEIQGNFLMSKSMEKSPNESASGILFAKDEYEFMITSKSFQDFDILEKEFDPFSIEGTTSIDRHWGPDSSLKSQCVPVRRSLVGSFEESLLSGRLSSGKASQRIDGFLAVLNVTGGSFSPPSQKLPFAVTSVEGLVLVYRLNLKTRFWCRQTHHGRSTIRGVRVSLEMAGRSTRQQSKQDQSRAKWTVSLTKILADLMAEQVLKGNRPNNSFGKKAWKCICDGFHKETGLKWDKEQLKNRYGVLRRQYVTIKSLLDQSDFSWDEPRRTVIATDEVWDKYIQTHPDAETIRNNGCPIYRQLCTIFSESGTNGGYDHSSHQVWDGGAPSLLPGQETGSMSIDPGAASIALDDSSSESEEHIDMLDVQNKHQSATPTSGRRKRNRKGIDDVIAEAILEIAVASKLRTTALTQSSEQFSISNCIKALDEIQGIDDRIYFAALDLFDSSSARETFLSLKNDKRLTWLKGKCDAPSTSTV